MTGTVVSTPSVEGGPAGFGPNTTATSFDMVVMRAGDSTRFRNDGRCETIPALQAGKTIEVSLWNAAVPRRKGETITVLYRHLTDRRGLDVTLYQALPVSR